MNLELLNLERAAITGRGYMSPSGMVEIPRLEAKRGFVMPAQAGIHLRASWKAKRNVDSGPGLGPGQALRRNDDPEESTSSRQI